MHNNILELRFEVLADPKIDTWLILENAMDLIQKADGIIEVDAADFTKIGEFSLRTGDILDD